MQPSNDFPSAPSEDRPRSARASVVDRRDTPTGVLPRQVQMWIMVVIAVVILLIIYLTGRPEPVPAPRPGDSSSAAPSSLPPDRVRTYQQRLAEQEARLRQEMARAQADAERPAVSMVPEEGPPSDPLVEERRRRDYQSLFADNVALSRRPPSERPDAEREGRAASPYPDVPELPVPAVPPWLAPAPIPSAQQTAGVPPAPSQAGTAPQLEGIATATSRLDAPAPRDPPTATARETPPIAAAGPMHRLLEGTFIDAVLTNRLDGSFSGGVNCMVTTPVYSHSRQHVVIPTGARLLGTASPVQAWGESRLAVRFHRLIMPDGRTYSLDRFAGLNQAGDAGLKDQVNRHYLQVFGASLAIGALAGLTQFQTRGGADPAYSFGDAYRQGLGSSLATSAGRVLDRFLNVLPTITVREGHRVKVYLTNDLELPEYSPNHQ